MNAGTEAAWYVINVLKILLYFVFNHYNRICVINFCSRMRTNSKCNVLRPWDANNFSWKTRITTTISGFKVACIADKRDHWSFRQFYERADRIYYKGFKTYLGLETFQTIISQVQNMFRITLCHLYGIQTHMCVHFKGIKP